jgi:hypothetical protein
VLEVRLRKEKACGRIDSRDRYMLQVFHAGVFKQGLARCRQHQISLCSTYSHKNGQERVSVYGLDNMV